MAKFRLFWNDGRIDDVDGEDFRDACARMNRPVEFFFDLDYYFREEDGIKVQVACRACCGCPCDPRKVTACVHDLGRVFTEAFFDEVSLIVVPIGYDAGI